MPAKSARRPASACSAIVRITFFTPLGSEIFTVRAADGVHSVRSAIFSVRSLSQLTR